VQRGGGGGGGHEHGAGTAAELHRRAQPSLIPATLGHQLHCTVPNPHSPTPIPYPYPDPVSASTSTSTSVSTSVSRIRRARAEPVGDAAAASALRRGCRPRVDTAPLYGARCGARCSARRNARFNTMHGAVHALLSSTAARRHSFPGWSMFRLGAATHTREEQPCRAEPLQGSAAACARSKHRRKSSFSPHVSTGFPILRHGRGGCAAAADGGQADGEQHGVDLRRARPAGGTNAQALRPLVAAKVT